MILFRWPTCSAPSVQLGELEEPAGVRTSVRGGGGGLTGDLTSWFCRSGGAGIHWGVGRSAPFHFAPELAFLPLLADPLFSPRSRCLYTLVPHFSRLSGLYSPHLRHLSLSHSSRVASAPGTLCDLILLVERTTLPLSSALGLNHQTRAVFLLMSFSFFRKTMVLRS